MKYVTLLYVLLLAGCTALEPTPTCVLAVGTVTYSVYDGPREVVMCTCESGAVIPLECGGGIAPVDSAYLARLDSLVEAAR